MFSMSTKLYMARGNFDFYIQAVVSLRSTKQYICTHMHTKHHFVQVQSGCCGTWGKKRRGACCPADWECSTVSPLACGHRAAASLMYLINLPQVLLNNVGSAGLLRDVAGEWGYVLLGCCLKIQHSSLKVQTFSYFGKWSKSCPVGFLKQNADCCYGNIKEE